MAYNIEHRISVQKDYEHHIIWMFNFDESSKENAKQLLEDYSNQHKPKDLEILVRVPCEIRVDKPFRGPEKMLAFTRFTVVKKESKKVETQLNELQKEIHKLRSITHYLENMIQKIRQENRNE